MTKNIVLLPGKREARKTPQIPRNDVPVFHNYPLLLLPSFSWLLWWLILDLVIKFKKDKVLMLCRKRDVLPLEKRQCRKLFYNVNFVWSYLNVNYLDWCAVCIFFYVQNETSEMNYTQNGRNHLFTYKFHSQNNHNCHFHKFSFEFIQEGISIAMFCYKRIDDPDSRIGVIHHGYEFYKKTKKPFFSSLDLVYFDKKINVYI